MRFGSVAIAYQEPRFIGPHLRHIPDWVSTKLVLVSEQPWQGEAGGVDHTAEAARANGAEVLTYPWPDEQTQRNAGQEYLYDMDWIIVLDPDEFLTDIGWANLRTFLETAELDAYVCQAQNTYWKSHMVIRPQESYRQIIAVRPSVRFVDKRVIDSQWSYAPVILEHMSWARTDAEVRKKITHYSHAHELDRNWYKNVWLSDRTTNLHPLTPPDLAKAIPADLPPELERLNIWPS